LKIIFLEKDEFVFHINSIGDKFYISVEGSVSIHIKLPDKKDLLMVKVLESGSSFGELALLNNKPRMASIKCETDSYLMYLDKNSFKSILGELEEEKLIKEMSFLSKFPFF